MNTGKRATLVIGLGEVGKPLYTILRKKDAGVVGIDIDPVSADRPVGILHICFPFKVSAQFEETVADYARKYQPQVITINSTVAPGTTRAIETRTGIPCVYSPVRGKHAKMVDDLYLYVKFVAGANAEATERVRAHFVDAGMLSETISAPETLELAKLLETTYFGLLIAWAQEMNRFAGAVGADYLEIGKFFREIAYLPKVLFQPGAIGGHCVMPNIELLERLFDSDFLKTMKRSNEARRAELAAQGESLPGQRLQPLQMT